MITFTVNGRHIETRDADRQLIGFLRDELRITSVKEGCGEGACGTCMVLVDGKAMRACAVKLGKLGGKNILTVEGLTKREKAVYTHCFTQAGAVQCGFCTPGMVISAKALLDINLSPARKEVKRAIHGNICRCTGYVKIEQAILMAAEYFRGNKPVPGEKQVSGSGTEAAANAGKLGMNFPRIDAEDKILGTGLYTDDVVIGGLVYASALRTKYPRAQILSIDTARAMAHPDCIRIITAEDIPGEIKCGHLVKDWDALIKTGDTTRYIGDALAIAVANTKESLPEILPLIDVEYKELTPLTSPLMALTDGAPDLHEGGNVLFEQKLRRGDAEAAIMTSKHVVTSHYSLPFTEHAFMEPECAVAVPDGEDSLLLYTGGQSIYDEQREISRLLGIVPEKIRVKSMLAGGGFGGKEDMSVQHHAALAAWLVKRPVKVKLSRAESILVHPKRHAMEIDLTTACDENGIITAVKADITADTGAYASLGGPVVQRACTHAGGPYNFKNIDIRGRAVYTNNPPAGAFRGFGVTQTCFAMESNLNLLAEKAGISAWEIRYRNAIEKGQVLPNGQIADDSTALKECLLAVKKAYDVSAYTGIACGFKNAGLGVGVPDTGRCTLSVHNGRIHVRCSAACIGQGMATVLKQMVCQTLNIQAELVTVEPPDTMRTPDSGTTTASRQTLFSGEAAIRAASRLLEDIKRIISENKEEEPSPISVLSALEGREYYGEYKSQTDAMGSDKENPVSHVSYSYAAQVAELDLHGSLKKVTAAYDIGTVVNPVAAEGQIEGGILMGAGYALTEDFPLENSVPKAKFGTLGLIRAAGAPEIEIIFTGSTQSDGTLPAYGAKGVGELAAIPAAPAITGAYYRFDGKHRKKLPIL